MPIPRLWAVFVFLLPLICVSSLPLPDSGGSLESSERLLFRPAFHESRFVDIPANVARSPCEDSHPPEALATPTPPLSAADEEDKLVVSFVVGADGRVHSALILEGDDTQEFRMLLDAVRHWRFRPATCNGIPTEVEAKVQFSRR